MHPQNSDDQVIESRQRRARSYQLEMLKRSLEGNVIVTMDTGSGKTEVAALRIRVGLDRCNGQERVWFLAPTVTLCEQQHRYLQSRLPDTSPIALIGSSNIDCWSTQAVWDAALLHHRVVISTPAILLDALRHAFVNLKSLVLLVFDEAHHCTKNDPTNRIMQEFYLPSKAKNESVPDILGLSASPMKGSKLKDIPIIENNLDSTCVSPRIHRAELLAHVHPPRLLMIPFVGSPASATIGNPALTTLRQLKQQLATDFETLLREVGLHDTPIISPRAVSKQDTDRWVYNLNLFEKKAERMLKELGQWATHQFVSRNIDLCARYGQHVFNVNLNYDVRFKQIILRFFNRYWPNRTSATASINDYESLSNKASNLVDLIAQQDPDETSGLIFVQERATVSILFQILSSHPKISGRFQFGTFVGVSNNSKRRFGLHELLDIHVQGSSLQEFRARKKHIIIATAVLEEGIDVAACNLVVCFDLPPTLKSFIQRRGRAREQQSQYALFLDHEDKNKKLHHFVHLEREMNRLCQDESRDRNTIALLENQDEEMSLVLCDPTTNARLTADSTKDRLYHFCATLSTPPFVETRPMFSISATGDSSLTAQVTLPNCVGALPRTYHAFKDFKTEQAAKKAAAFACYESLYKLSLLTPNLLPKVEAVEQRCQNLPAVIEVEQQLQPWRDIASAWGKTGGPIYRTVLRVTDGSTKSHFAISIMTPTKLPAISRLHLRPKDGRVLTVDTIQASSSCTALKSDELAEYRRRTMELYSEGQEQYEEASDLVYPVDYEKKTPETRDILAMVIRHLEDLMVAAQLQNSMQLSCPLRTLRSVASAITASSASDSSTFSRLGFLGDAILKLVITTQTLFEHVNWPSGWLTQHRNNLISNASLGNAAFSLGLHRYILTTKSRAKHTLLYRISSATEPPGKRELSSKTLADTVQALVTVAYMDGEFALARRCVNYFIPEIRAQPGIGRMPRGAPGPQQTIHEVQQLTGYKFKNTTTLMQALTHPSCASPNSEESYQRLAFLGDAVLYFLVAEVLFQDTRQLSGGRMTEIRVATINDNMLAFVCMSHGFTRESFEIEQIDGKRFQEVPHTESLQLWKYMRFESRSMAEAQNACLDRFQAMRHEISTRLETGQSYPWDLLAELRPETFYADLIQGMIGAIFVDSDQDLEACRGFLDTIGITAHLHRMLEGDYTVAHPRSVLQHICPTAKVRHQRGSDDSYRAWVDVEEGEIGNVDGCKSRDEATILASQRALQILAKDHAE